MAKTTDSLLLILWVLTLGLDSFAGSDKAPGLIYPENFIYQGAFSLPGPEGRENSFSYGGYAMTYAPLNKGSLFIMGHPRLGYGEFENGNQVAQVDIPIPIISKHITRLNRAKFVQKFTNIRGPLFAPYSEIPQVGMAYMETPKTGKKIHLCWGQHFHETPQEQVPTHAWFNPGLESSQIRGGWYIGNQSLYSTNAYLFGIDKAWADKYLGGRYLVSGRFRDGGWSGMGPSLFAYAPWLSGNPPPNGTRLEEKTLLLYQRSKTCSQIKRALTGYQYADDWAGGAWISIGKHKPCLIFAGTKATGAKYWYGWRHPEGEQYPCIETAFKDQFTTCRRKDGSACPPADLGGCSAHDDYRGWWSQKFNAAIIFYNPEDLARVATGQIQAFEPQPYAFFYIDSILFLTKGVEPGMLGTGNQRISRIASIAYDPAGLTHVNIVKCL
ncbi:MAG: hypothetical protein HUK40_01205 [Desulfobacter sp.]|nr:hypothetical protein [Desulfobacter sp.]